MEEGLPGPISCGPRQEVPVLSRRMMPSFWSGGRTSVFPGTGRGIGRRLGPLVAGQLILLLHHVDPRGCGARDSLTRAGQTEPGRRPNARLCLRNERRSRFQGVFHLAAFAYAM